ncbi:MAG: hypothetical protein ABSG62_21165 [Terracidiphilus sp.]|jgi:hypothetical protein
MNALAGKSSPGEIARLFVRLGTGVLLSGVDSIRFGAGIKGY